MFEPRRSVTERYTFHPSKHSSFAKILSYAGENKKILDVGCATGYLAEHLKQHDCYVVGIEIDEEAAKIAKQHCDEIIVDDVEHLEELRYPLHFFDIIIYGDILEHLKRPDLVLLRLKKYVSPNGYVIASIPNIARFEIRLQLFLGRFQYEDAGQLDITHLRFFTHKTVRQLFESTGYQIKTMDYTGLPSKIKMLRLFPSLFAYHFIVVAKPLAKNPKKAPYGSL